MIIEIEKKMSRAELHSTIMKTMGMDMVKPSEKLFVRFYSTGRIEEFDCEVIEVCEPRSQYDRETVRVKIEGGQIIRVKSHNIRGN